MLSAVESRHPLSGSFSILVLFDVAEQIRLDELRGALGPPLADAQVPKHTAADHVRFERPPLIEDAGTVRTASGERFQCRLKYFDYGVVSVEMLTSFAGGWDDVIALSARWIDSPEIERCAWNVLKPRVDRARRAFDQIYESPMNEDYRIIHIHQALDREGRPLTAFAMLETRPDEIAQVVLGEAVPVSEAERDRVLRSAMSYYPSDLVVTGWSAACIYDSSPDAAPVIQILEYANSQLLEFRHYDVVLTDVLRRVYRSLERRGGVFRRWKLAGEAEWLNTIRLDVTELTERADYAIKFLGDRYYARLYRAAAERIGVSENRNLVDDKLKTAGDLYEFMVNEFHQARAFVLEVLVVAILVIELAKIFRR